MQAGDLSKMFEYLFALSIKVSDNRIWLQSGTATINKKNAQERVIFPPLEVIKFEIFPLDLFKMQDVHSGAHTSLFFMHSGALSYKFLSDVIRMKNPMSCDLL